MSHNYLLSTHEFIKNEFTDARTAYNAASKDAGLRAFAEGRIQALKEFEAFIREQVDPMLPKKLYKKIMQQRGE